MGPELPGAHHVNFGDTRGAGTGERALAPKAVDRRAFVKRSVAVAALGGGGWACSPPKPRPRSDGARRTLTQAGPMLPPVPAVLLTANGKPGGPDEVSVVWTFVVNGDPPQVGVSVGQEHIVGDLVRLHGAFVLNVPSAEFVDAFDVIDMNSSREADKFALSGLTRGRATAVDAPTVSEAPIHVECRVFDAIEVPPVRTVFLAEVAATTVHEGVCDGDGRLIVSAVPFFGMTAGSGEFYTMGRRVGNIGMSVGRNDIKY